MNDTPRNDLNDLVMQIAMLLEAAERQSQVNTEQSAVIEQQRKQITAQIGQHQQSVQEWTALQKAILSRMADNQKAHFIHIDTQLDSATTAIPRQINAAIGQGIAETSQTIVGEVRAEIKQKVEPLLGQINSAVQKADMSGTGLKQIIQSLRWKVFASLGVLGGILAIVYSAAVYGLWSWHTSQVAALRAEESTLTTAIETAHQKKAIIYYQGKTIPLVTCGNKQIGFNTCILVRKDKVYSTDTYTFAVPEGY